MGKTNRDVLDLKSCMRFPKVGSFQRESVRAVDDLQDNGFRTGSRLGKHSRRHAEDTPTSYDDLTISGYDELVLAVPERVTLWYPGAQFSEVVRTTEVKQRCEALREQGVTSVELRCNDTLVVVALLDELEVTHTVPENVKSWKAERLLGLTEPRKYEEEEPCRLRFNKPSEWILVELVQEEGVVTAAKMVSPESPEPIILRRNTLLRAGFGRQTQKGKVLWRFWKRDKDFKYKKVQVTHQEE